jgi:hypothetical protein
VTFEAMAGPASPGNRFGKAAARNYPGKRDRFVAFLDVVVAAS